MIVFYRPSHYPGLARYAFRRARWSLRQRRQQTSVGRVDVVVDLSRATGETHVAEAIAKLDSDTNARLTIIPPNSPDVLEVWNALFQYVQLAPGIERVDVAGRSEAPQTGRAIRHLSINEAGSHEHSLARDVGVFLHLYYPEIAETVPELLDKLPVSYQLYVTTDTEEKATDIRRLLPEAVVRVAENRGRDIGAKFTAFAREHDDHDIVLHLHGKRSRHLVAEESGTDAGSIWGRHIYQCILHSPEHVSGILTQFEQNPQLGVVAPTHWASVSPTVNWAANRAVADVYTYPRGWPQLPESADLIFPVGSMFWARTDALRPVLDLQLKSEDFPPERGQTDGTLAHAVERLIGVGCRNAGYDFACTWPVEPQIKD